MKKLKYLFTLFVALCLLPNVASAAQDTYFKPYAIGDEITVTLDKDGKVKGKFIVIEASPEGTIKDSGEEFTKGTADYEYVTAVYAGTVGTSVFASKDATTYLSSAVRSSLVIKTTDANWLNYEEIRLLTLADLTRIGMKDNKVSASYLLTNAPYWLGENMQDAKAYSVDAKGNVSLINGTSTAQIRPVIKIHKGFVEGAMICNCSDCGTEKYCPNDPSMSIQSCIDSGKEESFCIMTLCTEKKEDKVCPNDSKVNIQSCIDEGSSEEDCIKKLCPNTEEVENPKTGSYLPIIGFGTIAVIVGAIYLATGKKTYFTK